MHSNNPLVTVSTTIFNTNPSYVIDAIKSIQNSTYKNIQHIILDDYSTNGYSKETVKKWVIENNYDCEFVEHTYNYGMCCTLNDIIRRAKGKYWIGCSDDLFAEDAIEKLVAIHEKNEDSSIVFCDNILINDKSKIIGEKVCEIKNLNEYDNKEIFEALVTRNFISAVGCMFRIDKLKEVNFFDESLSFEDYDINLRLSLISKICHLNQKLAFYRIHNEGAGIKINNWDSHYIKIFAKHIHISKTCVQRVNDIAISAFKRNDQEILSFANTIKPQSFVLKLTLLFNKLRMPKAIGYFILWRLK